MSIEQFWQLIEESRSRGTECEVQTKELTRLLEGLESEEIMSFYNLWSQKFREAYRWDLWAVAFIINGGCSDDGFMDFRSWLIAQGKAVFESALLSPESAANHVEDNEAASCEPIAYVATTVYKLKTGTEFPDEAVAGKHLLEPEGENWGEEDLPRLYPQLCERFEM